jgi:hypothetical protein
MSERIVGQSGHTEEALYNILLTALSKRDAIWQDAEKVRQLRSRLTEILNVPPEGTPPVSIRLRPCWTDFLSILRFLIQLHRYLYCQQCIV